MAPLPVEGWALFHVKQAQLSRWAAGTMSAGRLAAHIADQGEQKTMTLHNIHSPILSWDAACTSRPSPANWQRRATP
jgi:hypothetical protein